MNKYFSIYDKYYNMIINYNVQKIYLMHFKLF